MKKNLGFSLIEIVIALGLAALFLPGVATTFSLALQSASQGEAISQAYQLAQKGMEAIVYLKSQNDTAWDWQNTPLNTSTGEYYQPKQISGVWQLGSKTSSPSMTNPPFILKLQIDEIRRCGYEICNDPLAMVDVNSRKITVWVSWPEKNENQEVKLESYVTAH